ncbi:MAG: lipid-A-disaccharide synthase [Elainella sp. Prado103]|nr:lipid-A-disaccharide synthase [Elainella sp. Prado103]
MSLIDILILSNGPGELTTWVRPVVQALRHQADHRSLRISLVLAPCPNASGEEATIARGYSEIDRVQAATHFLPFLLFGKTAENWDWAPRGMVIFLGGDQFFPVVIGKRLGYKILIYGEWETRWHRWVDAFAVMKPELIDRVKPMYRSKFTVVGDLMADVPAALPPSPSSATTSTPTLTPTATQRFRVEAHPPIEQQSTDPTPSQPTIGLLPGSKPAKLMQGVPLGLAIIEQVRLVYPQMRVVLPVAPTLDLATLAQFANPDFNPAVAWFGGVTAQLVYQNDRPYLQTQTGLQVELWLASPAHDLLRQCDLCLTTVGANTAELGALAVPMLVLIPTQQLDAMRSWDGLPGLLANLPGIGTLFAQLINRWFLRHKRLLAWPNIWAGEMIVPELIGNLDPHQVAAQVIDWLQDPQQRLGIQQKLRQVRGAAGAADRLATLVYTLLDLN